MPEKQGKHRNIEFAHHYQLQEVEGQVSKERQKVSAIKVLAKYDSGSDSALQRSCDKTRAKNSALRVENVMVNNDDILRDYETKKDQREMLEVELEVAN